MIRALIAVAAAAFLGLTLLLSELRWFQRVGLDERLRPYVAGAGHRRRSALLSAEVFADVIGPLSRAVGNQLARIFRVGEELEVRLDRIRAPVDVTGFRVRQVAWGASSLALAVTFSVVMNVTPIVSIGFVAGLPLLAFLMLEQQLARASQLWQRRVRMELPVVTEQIGMLLSAGWSLSAALARVSERSAGACAKDLERVLARIRQGLSEIDALREWARRADIESLHRLVSVLALNRETADLGPLISEEARTMRKEAQRELVEAIERRMQQVWIPVTAATLVPGMMLMGVPFIDALSLFGP